MNTANLLTRFAPFLLAFTTALAWEPHSIRAAESPDHTVRPNILLIMVDDMGYSDLGCYGGEIETPHLDRLAAGGLRFTRFYNNAKCQPTRASLISGVHEERFQNHRNLGPDRHRAASFGDVLGAAGYYTVSAGKWHNSIDATKWGFERYSGMEGGCNYFNPGEKREGEPAPANFRNPRFLLWNHEGELSRWTPEDPDFYVTDYLTTYLMQALGDPRRAGRPFFAFLSFNAPHWPLQAPEEDIAEYEGVYDAGYDAIRQARYRRQVEMGLLDPATAPLTPTQGDWNDVEDKADEARLMQVHAAMVDRVDDNIGRLLAHLETTGELDNTLIFFLSDNGAAAEDYDIDKSVPAGPMDSFRCFRQNWANVSNTPLHNYKKSTWHGGHLTPLIVHGPGVENVGGFCREVGHVVDLSATFYDLAGAEYPAERDGVALLSLDGKSLVPLLRGESRPGHEFLAWKWNTRTALLKDGFKIIGNNGKNWQLFDLSQDLTEMNDISGQNPELTRELSAQWQVWHEDVSRDAEASSVVR